MFCPKCGAQSPDGSAFCGNCGEIFAPQSQPINQGQPMAQPQYGGQPMGQPAQYGAQPAYGQPYGAPKVRTPLDPKKKQAIIIASACAAVLAVFLVLLFAVIIPSGGAKGKLRYRWSVIEGGSSSGSDYIDLKSNTVSSYGNVAKLSSWNFSGNVLSMTAVNPNNPADQSTGRFICAFSPDGKTAYLYELPSNGLSSGNSSINYRRVDMVLSRVD